MDAWIICPFFLQGGRYTIDDIHYVADADRYIMNLQTGIVNSKNHHCLLLSFSLILVTYVGLFLLERLSLLKMLHLVIDLPILER